MGREDYRSNLIKLTVSPTLELQRDLITSPNVEESSFIYTKKSLNSNSDNEHEIHSSQKMENQTNLYSLHNMKRLVKLNSILSILFSNMGKRFCLIAMAKMMMRFFFLYHKIVAIVSI